MELKKPFIVLLIQISLAYFALVYSLNGIACISEYKFGFTSLKAGVTGTLILVPVGYCAAWLFILVRQRKIRLKWIYIFLWSVFVVSPLTNILISYDWFPKPQKLPPNELLGAAIVELGHYIWILMLIIWVRLSKGARQYLLSGVAKPASQAAASPEGL